MRKSTVWKFVGPSVVGGAALVALLAFSGHARAPKTTVKKKLAPVRQIAPLASLDNMLATALKYNTDIRLAERKLRDAEAELNRTRLRILQKIIALHHSLKSLRAALEGAESKYRRVEQLVRRGTVQPALLQEAEQELASAQSRYSEIESEMPYLLGRQEERLGKEIIRTEVQIGPRRAVASAISRDMAARIHKTLNRSVRVDYQATPLAEVLQGLQDKAQGLPFQRNLAIRDLGEVKVSLRLGEVSLAAALLALQDTIPGLRIAVRDYGLLVTWEHQVPLGGVRLYDFWKSAAESKR
jgi:hypothetical protein